jgi:class 3 adenylate cyclase/tetratricopeptide (TPR) repeat protein
MSQRPRQPTVDELLDRAVLAINSGDRATAENLASRVLAVDHANEDAGELLAAPLEHGLFRRLTIMFADLVDSTALSTRIEPETYRTVVGRYRDEVQRTVTRFEGHTGSTKGDGILAMFGHPQAHEDDVQRAVQAGLEITRAVAQLSKRVKSRFGFDISVRVGIHRGLVYLDTAQVDVYGLAANLTARVCSIAEPGSLAVSAAVERLIRHDFELVEGRPQSVKGIEDAIVAYRVVAERESTATPLGPLIGRHRELARLEESWETALAGDLTTAGLAFCGEPGIGKSRVARAAIAMAQRSDAVVLELVGSPLHADVGLHPVRRLLQRRCGIDRASEQSETLRALRTEVQALSLDNESTVARLAPVLGITPDLGYEPVHAEGDKLAGQITEAVDQYLIACTQGRPGLVLVEDMHWFDPASVKVVNSLLAANLGRVLVVMTSRTREALPDDSLTEVLEVPALTAAETEQLIVALHPNISEGARTTVRRRCDGVPLYIEEVVEKIKEQPVDVAVSSQVPDTLYEALFARLQTSDRTLRVAQIAATIGNHIDYGLLRSVTGLSDDDLHEVIAELQKNLVLEALDDRVWRFRHELLREVAAELAPPSIRRQLHSKVADALKADAAQGDPDWPMIALHFSRAERFDEAATAHQRASAAARRRGALTEALTHLARALDQLDRLPRSAERDHREVSLRLRQGLLTSTVEGAGSSSTAADFERCLELSGTDPHADDLFATLMALFSYYVNRADIRRADQVVQSLRFGVDGGREWWRAENLAGSGVNCWMRGEFTAARDYLEEAVNLAQARAQRDVEAEWFMPFDPLVLDLTSLAQARWATGDLVGADTALAAALDHADTIGFPQGPASKCYTLYIKTLACLESGRYLDADAAAMELTMQAISHGFDQWSGVAAVMHEAAVAASVLDTAPVESAALSGPIAVLSGWVNGCRFLQARFMLTTFDGLLARALCAVGRPADARARIDAGLRLAEETGMHYYDAELRRLRAVTHEDPAVRLADLESALSTAQDQKATVFALRAALDLFEMQGDSARPQLEAAFRELPKEAGWPEQARATAALD